MKDLNKLTKEELIELKNAYDEKSDEILDKIKWHEKEDERIKRESERDKNEEYIKQLAFKLGFKNNTPLKIYTQLESHKDFDIEDQIILDMYHPLVQVELMEYCLSYKLGGNIKTFSNNIIEFGYLYRDKIECFVYCDDVLVKIGYENTGDIPPSKIYEGLNKVFNLLDELRVQLSLEDLLNDDCDSLRCPLI